MTIAINNNVAACMLNKGKLKLPRAVSYTGGGGGGRRRRKSVYNVL